MNGDHYTVQELEAEKNRLRLQFGEKKTFLAKVELRWLLKTDQEHWALTNAAWLAIEKEAQEGLE